ncbi:PIN domain-containing protein [Candidatus Daviesbacteria bacterium]|nr:PIN domain-containing protein [Candidatus Daviesbacteria bacterium]
MIFVDTNYFLRFLLKDIGSQYQEAKNLFLLAGKGEEELISSTVVFFEVFWVLRSTYGKDKQTLVEILDKLLKLNIEFDKHQLLVSSVHLFAEANLSLEDCYNLTFAREQNVKSFRTFDLKLAKEFRTG